MALRVSEAELRELLVKRLEVIDTAEFDKGRAMAARLRIPLERALVERGRVPFLFLLEQLAATWGVGFIDLKVSDVQPEALGAIPEDYARAQTLIPFGRDGDRLHVAMWDPRARDVIDEIQRMTDLRVTVSLAPAQAIRSSSPPGPTSATRCECYRRKACCATAPTRSAGSAGSAGPAAGSVAGVAFAAAWGSSSCSRSTITSGAW
jgi:MshEN domain